MLPRVSTWNFSTATAVLTPIPVDPGCRPSAGASVVVVTERDGKRGGIHNSLTRVLLKPNHIVGGYAQLAYFFNYIGPIGNNRDEVTMIRRRTNQEVTY